MDIPAIARALQSAVLDPETVAAAVKALEHYYQPLTEKEKKVLETFQAERQDQLEAGLKVDPTPTSIKELQWRPLEPIHPLLVSQCVLTAAKHAGMPSGIQNQLQQQVLPSCLLRHPLPVNESAVVLEMLASFSFSTLPISATTAFVAALRCLAVKLFCPCESSNAVSEAQFRGSVCSSFSLTRVKPASAEECASFLSTARAPKTKDRILEDVQKLWWVQLSRLVEAYALYYARKQTHRRNGGKTKPEEAIYRSQRLPFSMSKMVHRLKGLAAWASQDSNTPSLFSKLDAHVQVTLAVLSPATRPLPLLSTAVLSTVQHHSGLISSFFGSNSVFGCQFSSNTLFLSDDDQVNRCLEMSLYNMGLTTASAQSFRDYIAVIFSLRSPLSETTVCLQRFLSEKKKEFFVPLLSPFVNNPKVMSTGLATEVAPLYTQLVRTFLVDSASPLMVSDAVLEASLQVLTTRCHNAVESATISRLCVALTAADGMEGLPAAAAKADVLSRYLQRELGAPSPESVSTALRLGAAWGGVPGSVLLPSYQAALKNACKDKEVRRMLLLFSPSAAHHAARWEGTVASELSPILLSELVMPLLDSCEEVEVDRPEAFLALYYGFSCGLPAMEKEIQGRLPSLLPFLSAADVLSSLIISDGNVFGREGNDALADAVAQRTLLVAKLLSEHGFHAPLLRLLTHPSGLLRLDIEKYLHHRVTNDPSGGAQLTKALWHELICAVLGLGADAVSASPPAILSASAEGAVEVVARLYFSQVVPPGQSRIDRLAGAVEGDDLSSLYLTLFLSFGHDYVQGTDPHFFKLRDFIRGRSPDYYAPLLVRSLTHLLSTAVKGDGFRSASKELPLSLMKNLLQRLYSPQSPYYVIVAACRGVVLLLSILSQEIRTTTTAIANAITDLEQTLHACFRLLLQQARESVAALSSKPSRDLALAGGAMEMELDWIDAELRAQNLIKDYGDRPPKGVSADDFADMKKKDLAALEKAKNALEAECSKHRESVVRGTRCLIAPFATIRLLGSTTAVDCSATAVLYPYLLRQLSQEDETSSPFATQKPSDDDQDAKPSLPPLLSHLYLDSIRGLLSHTPFAPYVDGCTRLVCRCSGKRFLEPGDVRQISSLSLALRRSITQMLPAPLFVVLTSFCRVAFKAGEVNAALTTSIPAATQHQLLGVLLQSVGQPSLPNPAEAMRLFFFILANFPPLYKSVLQGVQVLMPFMESEELETIEHGMFMCGESVCDVTAASIARFSHFLTCRRALVMCSVFFHSKNCSSVVTSGVQNVVEEEHYGFQLEVADWTHLLYFLRAYGKNRRNALLIVEEMKQLLAFSEMTEAQHLAWVKEVCEVGGTASVVALHIFSPVLFPRAAVEGIDYLCELTALEGESLLKDVLEAGKVMLQDIAIDTLREIGPKLQTRLSKPSKDVVAAHKEQYLAIATVWLTIVSCRLQELPMLQSIIEQQSRTLTNSQSMMVHLCVCQSMMELTKYEAVGKMPQLDEFVEKCLKQVIHSGSYVKKKAHSYGLVGVISGLGLTSLRRYNIIEMIQKSAKEKQSEKAGAMILVEVLCEVLGRRFEPYALMLSEILLEGVTETDKHVADCAGDAVQVMMQKCLSGIGLRQLIPHLIEILSSDQAKRRVAPLNFIGYVASCSPKQLAATLPRVMKHIIPCLFEVNSTVSNAAFVALRRVAGVVSNPEIQEQVESILKAMRNPSTETETALDALLYTRFANVVDPASLALIVPVVSRGLSGQIKQTRSKAAQIVASMVSLVRDPKSLEPYADELIDLLQSAAQDPETEARTTSAKALAALCCAMGLHLVHRVALWCFGMLEKPTSGSIEKAGAAQVFAELVNMYGMSLMEHYYEKVEKGMLDERPGVREGFLCIMVYAPSTFEKEFFLEFLPSAFPWVLSGLSHFSDRVQEVALTAGDSIIGLYGTTNLNVVLGPLLEGVYSEATSLRHSSLLLSCKLLMHLAAHIRKRARIQRALEERQQTLLQGGEDVDAMMMTEENEAEGGALTLEAARDVEKRGVSLLGSLEEMLGTDNFVRLLSAVFCGSHEHNQNVRGQCNQAWHVCVASIRAAVKKIFDALCSLLVQLSSSFNPDCVEAAAKTIEYSMVIQETKEMFFEAFCQRYHEGDGEDEESDDACRTKRGALLCLAVVAGLVEKDKIINMGGQLVGCILPGIQHKNPEVQAAAGDLFGKVTAAVGPRLIEDAVRAQLNTSIRGVLQVVKVRPETALKIIFEHFNEKETAYTDHDLELLGEVITVEEVEEYLASYASPIVRMVLKCLQQNIEGASDVLQTLVEMVDEESREDVLKLLQQAAKAPSTRHAAVLGMEAYCLGTDVEDDLEGISIVLQTVISALSDEDAASRGEAVRILPCMFTDLEERIISTLDEQDIKDSSISKRTSGRYLVQYLEVVHSTLASTARSFLQGGVEESFFVLGEGEPRLFDALMGFYQRGLDYGTAEERIEAVEGMQDLMEFAPKSISANAANTVAGRCSKALFTRNEGSVVLALVKLCLQLLQFPANGKEKMVEGTMALALFNATLCDSGEARVVALQVMIQLLKRSEKYADLILGNIVTKKAAVDSPLFRTVLCRCVSVILRYSNFTKAHMQIPKLMALIRPMWEEVQSAGQAAAAGVGMGALCKSASVTDEQLQDFKEEVLRFISSSGLTSLAGYAAVYSLIMCTPQRIDANFINVSAEALAAAAKQRSSKLHTAWILRAAAAVVSTRTIPEAKFQLDRYVPLLREVLPTDTMMMSTAQFFYDQVSAAYPSAVATIEFANRGYSESCANGFDADLDDELMADLVP